MNAQDVYRRCQADPALRRLWLKLSVEANALIRARLDLSQPPQRGGFESARGAIAEAIKSPLSFDEWEILRLEENVPA